MSFRELKYLIVDHTLHAEPLISAWLWALGDARRRTNAVLEQLPAAAVDWHPPHSQQSIGTILYHLALIETDWLCTEVLEQPYPAHIASLLPYGARDEHGLLTYIQGVGLAQHRSRLEMVRQEVLRVYQAIDLDDFYRVRHLPDYDVTPEWVLHHLMQHEAEHRSEIVALRDNALRQLT
jgi:uncharacterized damage-inducible protein DinB